MNERAGLFRRLLFSAGCMYFGFCFVSLVFCQQPSILFTDVSAQTNIDFQHYDGSEGRYFLIESMSAGLAVFDYDNDGDLDVYLLNGAPLEGKASRNVLPNTLYRNEGDFRFTDVTSQSGLGDLGFGLGVGCADFNNDGFIDVYVSNYGENRFFRNLADGTFEEVSAQCGTSDGFRVGAGVSFFDMDADGDLDLFVGNYVRFDPASHETHFHKGVPGYPNPLRHEPDTDSLFRNEGNGSFTDVSLSSGIAELAGRSMGVVSFDADEDGDLDLYVANDSQENHLYRNDGSGRFEEDALLAGLAYDFQGSGQASMGIDVGDWDADGKEDLVATSFAEEMVMLYRNAGAGFFDDVTLASGIGPSSLAHVTWGVCRSDFDLDGFDDLFVAAGDLDDRRGQRGGKVNTTAFQVADLVYRGLGQSRFELVTDCWNGAAPIASTRGLLAADLDGDGDEDVVGIGSRGGTFVLRNDCPQKPIVRIDLSGTQGNRDALGIRVDLLVEGQVVRSQSLRSGRSYQSDCRSSLAFPITGKFLNKSLQIQAHWKDTPQKSGVTSGASLLLVEPLDPN